MESLLIKDKITSCLRGCFNQILIVLPYLGENLRTLAAFVSFSCLLLGTILKVLSTGFVHWRC